MSSLIRIGGIRSLSTANINDLARKYPFPLSLNPKPHEIFHLPTEADQAAIKRRYFELVKVHHPDAACARGIPAQVAEVRFQSIVAAYERLQHPGRTFISRDQIYHDEIQRRRRAYAGMGVRDMEMRRNAVHAEAKAGSLWQRDEGILFMVAILGMFAVMYHVATPTPSQIAQKQHEKSQKYLADARSRGKEDGMRRREEIRSWLRERNGNSQDTNEEDDASLPALSQTTTAASNQGDITKFGNAVSVRKSKRLPMYERE